MDRQLDGLIEAIADGFRAPGLHAKLDTPMARQEALRAEVASAEQAERTPALHPNLAEVYRARVASLREGLEQEGTTEVRKALRALVSGVEVHADRIELVGELSALLAAAGVEGFGGNAKSPLTCASGLGCSVSVDAGTRDLLDLLLVA